MVAAERPRANAITRFYEGIPTLDSYRLALLALIVLGIELIGFRRFV